MKEARRPSPESADRVGQPIAVLHEILTERRNKAPRPTIRVSYRPDMVVPEAIQKAIYRLGHKTKAA